MHPSVHMYIDIRTDSEKKNPIVDMQSQTKEKFKFHYTLHNYYYYLLNFPNLVDNYIIQSSVRLRVLLVIMAEESSKVNNSSL